MYIRVNVYPINRPIKPNGCAAKIRSAPMLSCNGTVPKCSLHTVGSHIPCTRAARIRALIKTTPK
eukprot:4241039-Pyramimonas_sp.AAC.1